MTATAELLTLSAPDEYTDGQWSLIGDLRPMFPATDGVYLRTSTQGNNTIGDAIRSMLPADVAARVELDPEYSGFYAYGTPDDLAVVTAAIDTLHADGWGQQ